ncbi:MAG: sulfite exporter TauE/SafE family protein [Deltaproteobacteria bacterium]|nr:sulfite exporter TauE/SafE family protein [Deltaproteobacteria bacterium]
MTFDRTTIFVALALLLAAFVKGTTGLGFPMIATPMVAMLLDIRTAITILVIPNILMDFAQILRGGFPSAVLRRFAWLLVLSVVGVFLGTKLLVMLPIWILNFTLGIMVLMFVSSQWIRFDFTISTNREQIVSPVVGLAAGFLNGMTNVAGPPLAMYLYSLKLPKLEFIKSIATIFVVTKASQLVAVSTWNLFTPQTLFLSLEVTVVVLLGFYAGLKTQDRIHQQTFNRWLLAFLFATGITLVIRSLR